MTRYLYLAFFIRSNDDDNNNNINNSNNNNNNNNSNNNNNCITINILQYLTFFLVVLARFIDIK